jgi:MFS family permease
MCFIVINLYGRVIRPLCELYGRRRLYQICNVLFVIFTLLCGEAKNLGMLLAFRFLAGCVGAAPLTIGPDLYQILWWPMKEVVRWLFSLLALC